MKNYYLDSSIAPTLSRHLVLNQQHDRVVLDYIGGIPGLLTLSGTVYYKKIDKDGHREATITTITIDPDHRRRGLATRVVRELENIFKQDYNVSYIYGEATDLGVPFWESVGHSAGGPGSKLAPMHKTISKVKRKSVGKINNQVMNIQ